ncbi:uncharacterized protein LOC143584982 [Bidens hawaiensis]|uniref:uncharacterized protein LOC143584982 n=1 Tax=Bidens hawaiensis TaxID=980011 RepID=UPI00404B32E1
MEHKCLILDSVSVRGKKNKTDYPLSKAIEASFGGAFTWNMIKCKQQEGSWECGYLVIRNMFEFVISSQFSLPNKIWNYTTNVTPEEIDKLIENIMTRFFISVFDDNMRAIKLSLESCLNK